MCLDSKENYQKPFQQNCKGKHSNKYINFWKIIKPFLIKKGHLENREIMLTQDKKIISRENELVKVFNKHYINIIQKSGGQKPTNIAKSHSIDTINKQLNSYATHIETILTY